MTTFQNCERSRGSGGRFLLRRDRSVASPLAGEGAVFGVVRSVEKRQTREWKCVKHGNENASNTGIVVVEAIVDML